MTTRRIAGAAGAILLLGATFAFGQGAGRSAATAEFAARPTPAPRIVTRTVTRTVKVPVIHTVTKTIKVPVTKIVTRTVIKTVTVAAPTAVPTTAPDATDTAVPSDNSGVTYNDVTVAKTSWSDDGPSDTPPDAGKKYVVAHITMTNNSDQNYDYNALNFQVEDDGNTRYGSTTMDDNISDHELTFGTLAPGQTVAGDLAFVVPSDVTSLGLLWTPQFDAPAQAVPLS